MTGNLFVLMAGLANYPGMGAETRLAEVQPGRSEGQTAVGCPCDANVNQDGFSDVLDWGTVIGCALDNDCSGCDISCDVNCDGTVDFNDIGAVFCRIGLGGAFGVECCTDPIGNCFTGGNDFCLWTTETSCLFLGGTFIDSGYSCLEGACIIDGDCDEISEAACLTQGGTFQGVDTDCPPPMGACITPSGCSITTPTQCFLLGGTFQGANSQCPSPLFGACTTPSGCTNTTQAQCALLNGTFQAGTSCPTGNCITDFGCGEAGSQQACEAVGGIFLGPDAVCPPNSCVTDAGCAPGLTCSAEHVCVPIDVAIPTVSEWGIIVLSLALMTGAKILGHAGRARATRAG